MTQQSPYYPPAPPHTHDKFIAAIIIGIVVTAIVAGGIGYGLGYGVGSLSKALGTSSLQTKATFVQGQVAIPARAGLSYLADEIRFTSLSTGSLSSEISIVGNTYQAYLPSDTSYTVLIFFFNMTKPPYSIIPNNCTPTPATFIPSGVHESQTFTC